MNAYADLTTLKSTSFLSLTGTGDDLYLRLLLEIASRAIGNYCDRFFHTWEGARYYDGAANRLFLDDILSIATLKTDDNMDGTFENSYTVNRDYEMYPLNKYPKEIIELSTRSTRAYSSFSDGNKKAIEITGVFGYGDGQSAAPYLSSGAVVNTGGITNSALTHALATGKGALLAIGQTVRIGTEQLYITGISTDTLTFERGMNGTVAVAHTAADVIYICLYPEPIKLACLIQAMRWWKRKDSAFQDMVGSAETGTLIYSKPLDADVKMLLSSYKRVHG